MSSLSKPRRDLIAKQGVSFLFCWWTWVLEFLCHKSSLHTVWILSALWFNVPCCALFQCDNDQGHCWDMDGLPGICHEKAVQSPLPTCCDAGSHSKAGMHTEEIVRALKNLAIYASSFFILYSESLGKAPFLVLFSLTAGSFCLYAQSQPWDLWTCNSLWLGLLSWFIYLRWWKYSSLFLKGIKECFWPGWNSVLGRINGQPGWSSTCRLSGCRFDLKFPWGEHFVWSFHGVCSLCHGHRTQCTPVVSTYVSSSTFQMLCPLELPLSTHKGSVGTGGAVL